MYFPPRSAMSHFAAALKKPHFFNVVFKKKVWFDTMKLHGYFTFAKIEFFKVCRTGVEGKLE